MGDPCDWVLATVVDGEPITATTHSAGGARSVVLAQDDSAVFSWAPQVALRGKGRVVVARVHRDACSHDDLPEPHVALVRRSQRTWVEWAGGAMKARLDAERDVSPDAYLGRLEGTAAVAAHHHEGSWEVLVALEGAGTFEVDGKAQRLAGPQVVVVPPGATHSFRPDAGVRLKAVQLYAPPGPEQRFKALGRDAARVRP